MRCFVAIDMTEEVKNELKKLQLQIRNNSGSSKISFTKDFHLTLKFLGELTPQKAEFVKKRLGSCKFRKFETALGDTGFFSSKGYIRVVWAGISPEEEALKLQREVDEALQGYFPKEKGFNAHLTLARVKYVSDKDRFLQLLKKLKAEKIRFAVNDFKLKMSTLTKEGPVYDDLAVYK